MMIYNIQCFRSLIFSYLRLKLVFFMDFEEEILKEFIKLVFILFRKIYLILFIVVVGHPYLFCFSYIIYFVFCCIYDRNNIIL